MIRIFHPKNKFRIYILLIIIILFRGTEIFANVTITKATGGAMSADKATNAAVPTYTTLGNVRLTEGANTDFAVGANVTITINAPTGWQFNSSANITSTFTAGRNITAATVISKTATVITVQISVGGTNRADVLTITGLQVRADDGANVPGTAFLSRGGTAVIAGCATGANLGDLSQTVGVVNRLLITLPGETFTDAITVAASGNSGPVTSQVSRTSFVITKIRACDQFLNVVTSYTGAKTISYSGPNSAVTIPSFITAVSFTSGASTTALTTILKKAETTTITATDGTVPGIASSSLVVNPGAINNFLVESNGGGSIGTQTAGTSFNIQIVSRDIENNICSAGPNVFTGTADLTSTGTLSAGGGTSAAFIAGVLAPKSVTISNTGTFTITATRTSGIQTGISNSFLVNNPVPTLTDISPICANVGGGTFILTVNGTNYNSTSIVKFNGINKPTSLINNSQLQATIQSSDLLVAGYFDITVFNPTPGGGTSSNDTLIVSSPPVINIQPVMQSGCPGYSAIFSVSATGLGMTYQWKKNGIALVNGGNITGATTSSLTINPAGFSDTSTFYTVVISTTCHADVISNNTKLNIIPNTSSTANISICDGQSYTPPGGTAQTTSGTYITVIPNAAGCDSTITTNLTVLPNTNSTANISICGGQSYTPPGGTSQTTSGTYITVIPNSAGCDSTITTNLTVIPNTSSTANISICDGQSYTPPGGSAQTTSATYVTVIPNASGCDSTITTNLTVVLNTSSSANISICGGQSYTPPGGSAQTTSGTYVTVIPNAAGCDSTITTNLTVIPNTSSTANISICDGQSYIPPGGTAQTTSGTYITVIPNEAGCDSTITTNLNVIPNTSSTVNISICDGQSYTPPGGTVQTTSGTYVTVIPNAEGCDSTITTNLTFIPNTWSIENISICDGQSYTPSGGIAQTTSGTYFTVIPNAEGCDSTIITNLTVIPNTGSTANISICDGQSYTPPGGTAQTTSGTYVTVIPNAAGCDSTITTNLTVIPNTSSTTNISICNGQNYTPPGGTAQTTSGTYVTVIPNAAGCDSTITTNLTVIPNTSSTANISICDGQSYTPPGGTAQTTSGTYVTVIPNAAGCDSTITTNLTVIPNTSSTANISICDGQNYTPPGGTAQTTSGTYITVIPNAAGCDSTITTNLTVIPNTSSTANISICDGQSYTPPGGTIQTTSGTYITVIPNAAGCDSTIITNLTVIPNTSSTANISICNGQSYTPPGGTIQTTSGTYVTVIPNAAGCDSTITTNLTVIQNTSSTANISICDGQSYTPPGGTAQTTSGTYVTVIPNTAGCDSTITTNLTVIQNSSSTANISICDGQSYTPPGGTVQTTSGTYVTVITNAAGCDSTITTNLTVIPNTSSTANISICDGQSYTPPGGTVQTTSGTYVTVIPNAAGCDSTITTNLTVIPNTSSTANISICDGQSYTPPGGTAQTTSGTYVTVIPNAAGCDSTITTNLTVIQNSSSTANISICNGQSYTPPGGTVQTTSGTYVTVIPNAAGCDSTITTNLTVIPNTSSTANISICDGQGYTPPGGSAQTTSGTYITVIPNAAGCDSTITTNLTVIPNTSSTANISICNGQSYTPPGGTVQTTSGTYITIIPNAAGCDSTITTNLTVIPNTSSTANISICNGQSYTPPGGTAQTTSGTYVTVIPNTAGCDSTITTNLTVIQNSSSTANISICDGQSYTPPGGTIQTTSGTYITVIPNAAGCDSTITTNLTVIPNTSSTANISICNGQSYTPPGGTVQTTSGIYITVIPNAAGCDSTITTNLTVIPNTSSTANISICNGQSYTPPGGTVQTTSGTYITVIPNAAGCDSTITTNLTVIPNTSSTANISICNGQSYTPPGGTVQSTSGTYVTVIPNAAGCDSTITTNLTVIPNTSSTANISICDGQSYTPPGGTIQTTSGTYITVIPNAAGCDSTITTNLTVIPNTSSTANISICNGQSYTPPGGTVQTTSGIYITVIPNAAGCDSTITTNLTVIPNTSSTANISICNGQSYTPPGGTVQTTSGTYITVIPNAAGCDSTITTNLTVIPNTSSTANISICDGQSYTPPGGTVQTTSGTYVTVIPNAAGCDSTITTNLTVIPNTSSTANISICNGQSYTPPGGTAQTTSGTYITIIPNAAGCDSTITTVLSVGASINTTINYSICLGESVTLPDLTVVFPVTTTDYMTTFPSILSPGCDSIITSHVIVSSLPTLNYTVTQIICNGNTGSVTLNVVNGIPPYNYGGSPTTNLSPGQYIYTVSDSIGCIDSATVTINPQPPVLNFNTSVIQIKCFGSKGSVSLSASGGISPYIFSGDNTTNLSAGTYNYTVTDANGCSKNVSVTINPEPPQLILTAAAQQIACYGGKGSVIVNATGGVPPYVHSNTPKVNLSAGTYNYSVTDSKGCIATAFAIITNAPANLTASVTTTKTRCDSNTGTASVTGHGGSAPYSFLWNTSPAQTTAQATGLAMGTYQVQVTDGHGCSTTVSATVAKQLSTTVTITGNAAVCPDDTISICATSGLTSYLWSNGETTRCANVPTAGTYSVIATNTYGCTSTASKAITAGTTPVTTITGDDFICPGVASSICATAGFTTYKWNTNSPSRCLTITTGGTYTVTVTNAAGCTATASTTVKPPMTFTTTKINGSCSNGYLGSATVNVNGQTGPYTYLWSNGETTQTISNLPAGNYSVVVTDINNCTGTVAAPITATKTASDYSSISSFFFDRDIQAGTYIWFSASVKVNYTGTYPVTILFSNQNILSSKFNLSPAKGKIIITNSAAMATTTFDGTDWITTTPPNPLGQYFISGYSYLATTLIAKNLSPVQWKGIWSASCPGMNSVDWKWSASVYSTFTSSLDLLGVKPLDASIGSPYGNNDPAGSPENYLSYCVIGARGGGIPSYTGTYTGIAHRNLCAPSICVDTLIAPRTKKPDPMNVDNKLYYSAFPNPFSSSVTIEFERIDKSCNTTIEIFNFSGQKMGSIFNKEVQPGVKYKSDFNAENLSSGIYFYKIISGDEIITGKLILNK